ncbi:DUF4160 domain-containing protein [Streptococcus uberis]|uniref:DUF4160 domain-containing protein n=1 Tax=Streptococcus uberis TaxID=1349 RepID=UPI0005444DB3|nr:DUF4160 domain-containing protein [Streptococcus uberis]KHD39760.1 hypothetical protein NA32_08530 [Streptococcus hongkongensis]SQG46729.1 Uncharacterised protein [Streptococcus uberis]
MEIILNEDSLKGQYCDVYEFKKYLEETFIPFYCSLKDSLLFSQSTLYSRVITKTDTFEDFIFGKVGKGMTARQVLIILLKNGNFWDSYSRKDKNCEYGCEEYNLETDCIYEAYERDKIVFSFTPSEFDKITEINIKKNKCRVTVENWLSLSDLKSIPLIGNKIPINEKFDAVIYKNEANHPPHFHILTNGEKVGAYQIPFLEEHDIKINAKDKHKIEEWIKRNYENIINLWNTVHPDRLVNRVVLNQDYELAYIKANQEKKDIIFSIFYKSNECGSYNSENGDIINSGFPESDSEDLRCLFSKKSDKIEELKKNIKSKEFK